MLHVDQANGVLKYITVWVVSATAKDGLFV